MEQHNCPTKLEAFNWLIEKAKSLNINFSQVVQDKVLWITVQICFEWPVINHDHLIAQSLILQMTQEIQDETLRRKVLVWAIIE